MGIDSGTAFMPASPAVTVSDSSTQVGSVAPPVLTPDMSKLRALGNTLASNFKTYESHRKLIELKWARNLRQFLGEYDNDVKKNLDSNRSQAYPRLTRVKCISMLSRLMNLLFPTTEKNWGLEASPIPNLSMQDLQTVLEQAQAGVQQSQAQLTGAIIEMAVRAFAEVRAKNLETEVEDQLSEVGGNRNLSYVSLCRKVLLSGILYGCGVLKGPFVRQQLQRRWIQNPQTGAYQPEQYMALRPQLEFVPIWDYYPDMTAKHLHQMDGQFHRMVVSKAQLRELADRPDFFSEEIKDYLKSNPKGNWRERTHETELRTIGVQSNVNVMSSNKYEVIIWDGFVASETLKDANIELPEGQSSDMVDASVWTIDNRVIKCAMSPWVEMEPDQRVQLYHHFIFEEDDSSIIGNGLPNIMRDSQMNMAAAARMLFDNASIVCGPNLEVNTELLRADQNMQSIQPYKIWYREGTGNEAAIPAVKNIDIASHIAELKTVVEMCQNFADQETFVNPATGGDMQKGPSEPFRTAAGASMLQGQAALPFKDVVRNYDAFTTSVINSIVLFNKHFNEDAEVQGDFSVIARGSSSLISKEVRGMALDMLAQTVQPEERKYIDWYKMLKERLAVRDVDVSGVLLDDDAAKQAEQAEQQKQQDDEDQMKELMKAEVRKLLADAAKSLTASDSNASSASEKDAKAQAVAYNSILAGLESGVSPADVRAAHQGAELPPAIAAGFRRTSGVDKPPKGTA